MVATTDRSNAQATTAGPERGTGHTGPPNTVAATAISEATCTSAHAKPGAGPTCGRARKDEKSHIYRQAPHPNTRGRMCTHTSGQATTPTHSKGVAHTQHTWYMSCWCKRDCASANCCCASAKLSSPAMAVGC
eukprot:3134011-Prymnesium_polylepis.1